MNISKNIYRLRMERNLTQNQLGKLVNIDGRQICRYELGINMPSTNSLKKIADLFGVTVDDLLMDNNEKVKTVRINDPELLCLFQLFDKMGVRERNGIKYIIKTFTVEDSSIKSFLSIER